MNRKAPSPLLRRCSCMLAVLAMLAPWTIPQASAHPYWPPKPNIAYKIDKVRKQKVYRLVLRFNVPKPADRGAFDPPTNYTTMGLNWCRAKDALPPGWDTQDNRALRTGSMCQEPPFYGSLGHDYPHSNDPTWGDRVWTTPDDYSFSDGRYIISINGWTFGVHHAGGNHTTLHLFNIDVPDGKTPASN